jgi:hypothetical protein
MHWVLAGQVGGTPGFQPQEFLKIIGRLRKMCWPQCLRCWSVKHFPVSQAFPDTVFPAIHTTQAEQLPSAVDQKAGWEELCAVLKVTHDP